MSGRKRGAQNSRAGSSKRSKPLQKLAIWPAGKGSSSKFGQCPFCGLHFPHHEVDAHVNSHLDRLNEAPNFVTREVGELGSSEMSRSQGSDAAGVHSGDEVPEPRHLAESGQEPVAPEECVHDEEKPLQGGAAGNATGSPASNSHANSHFDSLNEAPNIVTREVGELGSSGMSRSQGSDAAGMHSGDEVPEPHHLAESSQEPVAPEVRVEEPLQGGAAGNATGSPAAKGKATARNWLSELSGVLAGPNYKVKEVPGLFQVDDFITAEEEEIIVSHLDAEGYQQSHKWEKTGYNGVYWVQHWGHKTLHSKGRVVEGDTPIPEYLQFLIQRWRFDKEKKLPMLRNHAATEANAIVYDKALGHFLEPHVDDRRLSGECLATLSLLSDCKMTFKRDGKAASKDKGFDVVMRRRSLQAVSNSAR